MTAMRVTSFLLRCPRGLRRLVPSVAAALVLLVVAVPESRAQGARESAPKRKPQSAAPKPAQAPDAQAPAPPEKQAAPPVAKPAPTAGPTTSPVATKPVKVKKAAKKGVKVAETPPAATPEKAPAISAPVISAPVQRTTVGASAIAPLTPAAPGAPGAPVLAPKLIEAAPAAVPQPSAAPAPGGIVAAPEGTAPSVAAPLRRTYLGTPETLRARWKVETPIVWVASPLDRRVSPGLGFASPGGYGPAWGDAYASASYQQRTRRTKLADAGWGVGIGLGDPARFVGAEVAYAGFGTARAGFFTNGTISARLHRIVGGYGIALGRENIATVGGISGPGPDGGGSNYVAVSRLLRLGVRDSLSTVDSTPVRELMWTIGVGDGRFRREPDVLAGKSGVNVFGSLGFRFHERFAAIVDYTGQDVAVALSVVPFRCFPLVVTPGMADVTGMAGDGARFVLAVGMTARLDPGSLFSFRCSR